MATETSAASTRERVPFRVIDADGNTTELAYSSPAALAMSSTSSFSWDR